MASIESVNTNAKDLKEIKDTLYSISDKLKYYFKNVSIEDNFSPEAFLQFKESEDSVSAAELTEKGLTSYFADMKQQIATKMALLESGIELSVSKGDLTNQMNIEPGAINIKGNRLEITGENFSIDSNNKVTVKGNIKASSGKIAGWSISSSGQMVGGTNSKIKCKTFNNSNDIYLTRLEVHDTPGDTDLTYCSVSGGGTLFLTDENTVFLNGFKADSLLVNGDVHCGILTSHGQIAINSQIVAKRCYTKKNGSTWSDRRLKDDIRIIGDLEAEYMINNIQPYTFDWKSGGHESGFIAQDIDNIQKEMEIDYGLIGRSGEYMTLNYHGVMMFLLKILQKQTKRLDAYAE